MKKNLFGVTIALFLAGMFIAGAIFTPEAFAAGNRVIVVFDPASFPAERRDIVLQNGCSIIRELSIVPSIVIHLPLQASQKARDAILEHAPVIRIEDDLIVEASKKPQDPGGGKPPKPPKEPEEQPEETLPWGVDRIDAEVAWANSTGSAVKVAVLDTGIDTEHPDLIDNIGGGTNIINPRKHFKDDNGHGTHVAGIIAAVDQGIAGVDPETGKDSDGIGVIGVAPKALLYGVKVLDRRGIGWLSDVVAGLEWCVGNGMNVVNMSLSAPSYSQTFKDAVAYVYGEGIVQVAAAGNDGTAVAYPAAYPETIAVSATDSGDNVVSWSNYGPEIDLAAPGAAINSTYKGGEYKVLSGTSMAAPHVAGCVALVLENHPNYTPHEVLATLTNTAEGLGLDPLKQGEGLVDAEAAVAAF